MAASAPVGRQRREALAHRRGQFDGAGGVVGLQHRVVKEGHEPIAGEMLERSLVLDDQRAHRGVVGAQEAEYLLGFGGLGEDREVAQVTEHRGDLAPVAGQHRLAVGARHEGRDLWRQEARQLGALSVDGREQVAFVVAEPLLRQGRVHPGSKDLRIDRLGQVVGRAHLDAADHAVELVDARDHDDRQVAQPIGGPQRCERLVAVHDRHHDVEQDEIDRGSLTVGQAVERLAPVLGFDRLVTDRLEQADQQPAIERCVVDDEDATGRHRALAATSVAWSASGAIGFEM